MIIHNAPGAAGGKDPLVAVHRQVAIGIVKLIGNRSKLPRAGIIIVVECNFVVANGMNGLVFEFVDTKDHYLSRYNNSRLSPNTL